MLRTIGSVEERRTSEEIAKLDRRLTPQRQYVSVDFGSTPTTTAMVRIPGLTWVTYEHCLVFGLTTQAQATANLRVAAIEIDPGKAVMVHAVSNTNLSGVQRLSMVAL